MRLRPLESGDLERVLVWRNHPDVRKNMYTTHEISREEHLAWWAKVEHDKTKQYFVAVDGDEPLGVVNFVDISVRNKTATWAFYSGVLDRRGLGSQMESLALDHAFGPLGLEKLSCEVLAFNAPVIRLHKKFGFRVEGVFRRHHDTADIYRLAIFKADWRGQPSLPNTTATFELDIAALPAAVCGHFGGTRVIATRLTRIDDGLVTARVATKFAASTIVEVDGAIAGDIELGE
jgi:UDP-4-amino-4,6-dideoxy-N-acetyl-beta-L-altrosamine N-acetyltransferase